MVSSDGSEPERRRPRSTLRRAGLVVLAVAALAAVGYLIVGFVLHSVMDPDRLARWTEARLERSLNRNVEVGAVRLGVFPRLEVDLRGLRVDNPPQFDAPPFAEIERVSLGVALLPLLRRRVEVDDAGVSGAEVRLRVLRDGSTNYGDFVPAREEETGTEEPGPLRAEVGRVDIGGVTVSYRNDSTGLRAEARSVAGEATMDEGGEEGRPVEVRLDAGEVSVSGLPGGRSLEPRSAGLEILGEAQPELHWLRIREGELGIEPVRIAVEGRVDSLRSPIRRLDLRLSAESLDLEDLMVLAEGLAAAEAGAAGRTTAWDSLRPAGAVDLDVTVRGRLGGGHRPDFQGRAALREGSYGAAGRPPVAEGLGGEVRIAADSLRIEGLRGRLLEGPLELSGAVAVDSPRGFRAAVAAAPRLEAWPRAVPGEPPAADLTGSAELDLVVRGRPGAPSGFRATGTVRPDGIRIRRKRWSGDLAFPGGSVRLTGDGLAGTGMPVVAAGDTLRADLEVTGIFSSRGEEGGVPSLTAELRGRRLALDALIGRRSADSVTYGKLAFARLGGGRVAGRRPEELAALEGLRRPASLPLRGTVRAVLGQVTWGPYRMDDVEIEARLAPDRLEISDARLSTFGGDVTGTFGLDLVPGPLAPFSLELAVDGAETARLLSTLTPLGGVATGTASLSLATAGRLDTLLLPVADTLAGDGRMDASEGRVRENPVTSALARTLAQPALGSPGFQRWTLPFEIRGDELRLPPGQLRGGPLPVDFAGHVGFGGGMDLAATVQLPRDAASSLAGRVGGLPSALLRRVAGGQGPVPVGLSLRGTLAEPRIQVQVDALRQTLESAVREEAGGQLEEKAGGLLRNILGGRRDTARSDTAAAPGDTAAAPPDTAGARRPDRSP